MSLHRVYNEFHEQVRFAMIYIREAHPTDKWSIDANAVQRKDPTTLEERRATAEECESTLQYGIKTYVDDMDDAVATAYAAWPERLYLIGRGGVVFYRGGLGPWGFNPSELQAAIVELLGVPGHRSPRRY